ncbi:M20/M25/M40 family metallo-hydrolase [Duganella sp. FT3S]|uniref:M20/M25/M40 family metallo-hydrolase n=1 Tax=Rugamonas fusca TaxID=2758568 RepID=A0A7W2EGZ1_9BURK|nr:M20/M25/M40 family metallo-hydrolase [Rugamonas fusca]MBA5605738.1 M20/M25/M40 family metallo-hydrolase [Rugamonas fusca]
MARRYIAALLAGLGMGAAWAAPQHAWISLGDAAYAELKLAAPQAIARESRATAQGAAALAHGERIHLVEVDEQQMLALSASVHRRLHRCGGFMYHPSEAAGLTALMPAPRTALAAPTRPSYVIAQQAVAAPMLSQMQASNIGQTIVDMSAYANRYYTTNNGVNASDWLRQRWSTLAAGRPDIAVSQFTHGAFPQKSVIATINGSDNGSQVVVLGGHLDSINQAGTSETTGAPGADDDASGVASLTELLRVIVASGYHPRRTIKLIGYAAEEVGLRGSQDIAQSFKRDGVNVVGVMQLDMTNYHGSQYDIYLYTDYTDSAQNDFVQRLIGSYLPTLKVGYDQCGYACSDHASWTAQGYWSSMPFETTLDEDNPYIHTANDTYANSGNQADNALKFARMAMAYAVELGSEGPGTPPPADRTETASGTLAKGQKVSYGPYHVAAGGSFAATLSGSGDTDLYVRKGAAASTSGYDCKSDGPTSAESCTVSLSANGDVYVLLNGYSAASYTLTVRYRPQ